MLVLISMIMIPDTDFERLMAYDNFGESHCITMIPLKDGVTWQEGRRTLEWYYQLVTFKRELSVLTVQSSPHRWKFSDIVHSSLQADSVEAFQ